MNRKSNRTKKLIDYSILFFMFLFLGSLTNSIFINQIGYFGSLILVLFRFAVTKESKFNKTGLEQAIILFLLAELISAILSIDKPHAFQNAFKRFILIPIIYTIIASADSTDRAKLFFKIFLIAAVLTILAYIIFAYEHFISQLYQTELKGPSPFQYVMTAGGLISFTVIYLFAFLMNEKQKISYKIINLVLFTVALIALFASYTRAAWLGAAVGIMFVLIMRKKWWLTALLVSIFIFMLFYPPNVSKVFIYNIQNNTLNKEKEINTNGRPFCVTAESGNMIVSDFENGVLYYKNENLKKRISTPVPSVYSSRWTNEYDFSVLADTRFVLIQKDNNEPSAIISEFETHGRTSFLSVVNNYIYVSDLDSGITIFTNPENTNQIIRFPQLSFIKNFYVDSNYFATYNLKSKSIIIYGMNDFLPGVLIDSLYIKTSFGTIWVNEQNVYFQDENSVQHFIIKDGKLSHVETFNSLREINHVFPSGKKIIASTLDGRIYFLKYNSKGGLEIEQTFELGYMPTSVAVDGDKIFTSLVKRNRVLSIFDLYHTSNVERLKQWKTGFKILGSYPLFGVGDIDLQPVYAKFKSKYEKENFGHLHNNYVHIIVILGILGFAAFLFLLVKIIMLDLKIYKRVKNIPFISSYALGTLAAFTGFLFSGLAEWNFGDQEIITMVWFTLGLNIAFYKNYLSKNVKSND